MEVECTSPRDGNSAQAPPFPTPPNTRKRRRSVCLVVIAFILGMFLILLILGLTVFKVKQPVTTVHSVALKDLEFSLDIPRLKVHLNILLDVNLSIKNENKIGFKFTNSSAFIKYRGKVVGQAPIPAGKISPDKTSFMNVTVTFMADRLLSDSDLYADVISGTLPLSTFTRTSGKVNILKIFKIHVVTYTTCDIIINIKKRSVANQKCHYKTKL